MHIVYIYVQIYVCVEFSSSHDAVKSDEITHYIAYFTIRSILDIRHALLRLIFVNHIPFPGPHGCIYFHYYYFCLLLVCLNSAAVKKEEIFVVGACLGETDDGKRYCGDNRQMEDIIFRICRELFYFEKYRIQNTEYWYIWQQSIRKKNPSIIQGYTV